MSEVNPYADRIVPDPETRPPVSVVSFHREHLEVIAERVLDGVENGRNYTQASVLVSSNPGSGKTHLLSRIIDAISAKTLPVFIPPINESGALGRAVLNRLVTRLWRMVESGRRMNRFEWLTLQLIGLACREHPSIGKEWREFPVDDLHEAYFQDWLRENREALERHLSRHLEDLLARPLHEPAAVWSRALIDVLSSDPEVETLAVDWIRGRVRSYPGLSREEAEVTEPLDEAARATERLFDVTQFFGLCRPVVFVFDQVENFGAFGPAVLRSLFVLIERLLVNCGWTQVVVAANAADWHEFVRVAELPESYRDRFAAPRVLRGLEEREARELRDVRAGLERVERARERVPDRQVREWLGVGPDGRAQREVTPRELLRKCAEAWESRLVVREEADNLDRELGKARALAEREELGFFEENVRTFLREVLGAKAVDVDGYGFEQVGELAIFVESSMHWRRWEAWAKRADRLEAPGLRAVRPGRELSALSRLAYGPVPSQTWREAHPLRELLRQKRLHFVELEPGQMLELTAACRLMDAAADLGRTRGEVAAWLRERMGGRWRDFFSAPAGKAAKGPAGAVEKVRGGVVMLSVTRLMDLLARPGAALEPSRQLRPRERGLVFHQLACGFVRYLLENGRTAVDVREEMESFLKREPLWRDAAHYDAGPPRVRDALEVFADRIAGLRDGAEGLRSWEELYVSTELQVHQSLGIYNGVTVLLTGRCDVLRRRRPGGPPEIVDYKLTEAGGHAVEQQLQLALYARLLSRGANPVECGGTLEIYRPELTEARFTHAELLRFFESEIEPALRKMAREASPGVVLEIDTVGKLGGRVPPEVEGAFEGFVGNREVVGRLKTALADAWLDERPPVLRRNLLFTGSGGTGKTELARRVARALRRPLVEVPAGRVRDVDGLLELLDAELERAGTPAIADGIESGLARFVYPPVVVFLDEVHEWRKRADAFLSVFEPRERRAVGAKIADLRAATLIAATTDAGRLPRPFLTRFHQFALQPYDAAEVAEILRGAGVPGDAGFREGLAVMARLNPRVAKLQAQEFMMHQRVHGLSEDEAGLERLAAVLGVDRRGLEARDRRYLELLRDGPVALRTLANALQVDEGEICRDVEPYLLRLGLIATGRSGRRLTERGLEIIEAAR